MAIGPTLPPQAYTREMLSTAFNWLQAQPDSVRKLATSPDALVGLFLRAQRFGATSFEADAPVSSQNFMSDLKDLAEGLKQFEEPKMEAPPIRPASHAQASAYRSQLNSHAPSSFQNSGSGSSSGSSLNQNHAPIPAPMIGFSDLNSRSQQMIQEVKIHLNLSSEAEAVNMMVALAYKNLKNLLA